MKITDANGTVRYLGKWRGRVSAIDDPNEQLRIRAFIPGVYGGTESPWALPGGLAPGQSGLPDIGAQVFFEFEQGDPNDAIWTGIVPSAKGGSQEASPTVRAVDDETVAVVIGKGGGAVTIPDAAAPGGERLLVEPITASKPSYGNVKELRVGQTLVEVDGTPGEERVNIFHKSGAYFEIGPTGSIRKVSRGQEHDWAKGSRTVITTGQKTEVVSGTLKEDLQKSVERTVGGDITETVKGGETRTVRGSVNLDIQDGSRRNTVAGLDFRRAGAVSDISLGGRSLHTGGSLEELITGAHLLAVQNKDFVTGQRVGYGVSLALGDFEFNAVTGDYIVNTAVGKFTVKKTGEFAWQNAVGKISMDPLGQIEARGLNVKLGNGIVDLVDILDKTLDACIANTTIGIPGTSVPVWTALKTALLTIKSL